MRCELLYFLRAELSRILKLRLCIMRRSNFISERKWTFFRFLMARTDIVSVLNLTSSSHHRRFRWDERPFIFSAPRTVLNCKACIMRRSNFRSERKLTFFRFFLARTDIISVLNLTRNSRSHHHRWDEISFIFFPPTELSRIVKLRLCIMRRSKFKSDWK